VFGMFNRVEICYGCGMDLSIHSSVSLFTQHRLISNSLDHLVYAFDLRLETLMISFLPSVVL
jgi:hypothetical protein